MTEHGARRGKALSMPRYRSPAGGAFAIMDDAWPIDPSATDHRMAILIDEGRQVAVRINPGPVQTILPIIRRAQTPSVRAEVEPWH